MSGGNVVRIVNCILDQLKIHKRVSVLEDITPNVFVSIFEELIGEELKGARKASTTNRDNEYNCRIMLDKLAEIVGVSLDHISPISLVDGDPVSVANLVEIFSGLIEELMDSIATESEPEEKNSFSLQHDENQVDKTSSTEQNSLNRLDDLTYRYPNIISVVGRDRALRVFESEPSSLEKLDDLDPDLESLLNVDIETDHWKKTSPLQNRKTTFPDEQPTSFNYPRKITKISSISVDDKKKFNGNSKHGITFGKLPRRENPSNSGALLDSSSFKATFSELKTDLKNEKAELDKRLKTVKARYQQAEHLAKMEADEESHLLKTHNQTNVNTSFASTSSLMNYNRPTKVGSLLRRNAPTTSKGSKKKQPTFNHVGFLSKTRAEERKKMAAKRICAKYRSSGGSPKEKPGSPGAFNRKDLIARLQEHFPGLEMDDATSRRLWAEYSRHVQALGRVADSARLATRRQTREATLALAERQQQILLQIVRREMLHAKRLREENERRHELVFAKNRVEDAKIQRIRSERYYNEFVEQTRARMANKQFGEEMIFRNLFKEAIKAQRERLLDLASCARELATQRDSAEATRAAKLRCEFQSRLRLLNEKMSNERQLVECHEKEQARYLSQMKRELRSRLESDLRGAQSQMAADFAAERVAFRELDAEAVKMQIYGESKQSQPFLK